MEKIPIEYKEWLNYQDHIYILRGGGDKGTLVRWQFNGVACNQASIKGVVFAKFQSGSKYFNPTFWYKKTTWGSEYPKKLYFDTGKVKVKGNWADNKYWERLNEAINPYCRPSENVLKAILESASLRTGLDISFPYENTDYGVHWYEAFVPMLIGKKKYILTWMNCD